MGSRRNRIAALLCCAFESGKAAFDLDLDERSAVGNYTDEWLDGYARENAADLDHDWPLWLEQADRVIALDEVPVGSPDTLPALGDRQPVRVWRDGDSWSYQTGTGFGGAFSRDEALYWAGWWEGRRLLAATVSRLVDKGDSDE